MQDVPADGRRAARDEAADGTGDMKTRAPEKRAARRSRRSRAERSEEIRRALFRAAAEIVGEVGYAEASVARITARAKVAQGTFYNYFESRQDLFDQLLPGLGASMLAFIMERVDPAATGAERETQRLAAYFQFLEEHPEFYRILYEAETLAPAAHRQHVAVVASGYVRALKRSWERGEMPGFDEHELEPIAFILLAARGYLSMRYGMGGTGGRVPDWVVEAYSKFVRHGLFSEPHASEPDGGTDRVATGRDGARGRAVPARKSGDRSAGPKGTRRGQTLPG
jgi:AcrR family transcriptional regulator